MICLKSFAVDASWKVRALTAGVRVIVVLGVLGWTCFRGQCAAAPVFYVATNGNDAWSGTLRAPDRKASDGPFASLSRAVAAVREARTQSAGPVVVRMRGGYHFLSEPLRLDPEAGGRPGAIVSFEAYKNENPVVSGGRRISGWRRVKANDREVWAADLPEVREGRWKFHQLWVDGERRLRARHPNRGYLAVAELPGVKPELPWTEGQSAFRFAAGDLRAWSTASQGEVCVMNRWVESRLPIVSIDEPDRIARFGKRSVFKLDVGDLYYVEGVLELLDEPGEWFLDRKTGTLYYLPRPGERMDQVEVIAPVLTQLLRLEGRLEERAYVEHVRFSGLTFAHTEWYFPGGFASGDSKPEVHPPPASEVGGFAQAAIGVPGAIWGAGVRHAGFENCRFVHLGTYGLELGRACHSNRISRCEFGDLGGGGIRLGETSLRKSGEDISSGNEVSDCHIHDGGRVFHSAIGVWIGQSPGNRVLHNHIHDFYYTGISVGWTWGYDRALATNTLVAFNHVHHIGKRADGDGPILSDMAGIYTLGLHRGSVIRNNLWHDSAGLRYGGWGIYFDEGTSEMLAENNLVYRTTHGGFHQHYGRDNVVRNNIFVDARDYQVQRTRSEPHRSFTFERNIVSWSQGRLLEGNYSDTNYQFRSNVYWNGGKDPVKFGRWTLEEWRQRGLDLDSIIGDPFFVDPKAGDYRLKGGSPAFKLGFEPLDLRRVGPRQRGR